MKIGETIKRMRELRGMTQHELGEAVGFPARNAAIRIAQYETNYRIPKKALIECIAEVLDISPFALSETSFESYYSLYQALFALEDMYDAEVRIIEGQPMIAFGKKRTDQKNINEFLSRWSKMKQSFDNEKITIDEYDEWRYSYPKMETRKQR